MKLELTYGDGKIEVEIPEKNLAAKVVPKAIKTIDDILTELNRVLDNPHGPTIEDLSKSKNVCVLVEDHTRDEPHFELLSAVIPRLIDANKVTFVITTGSHEVNHPGNLAIVELINQVSKDTKIQSFEVSINDCQDSDVVDFGKTSRNTPVLIGKAAAGHDLYIAIADMKAHYFAGYSNALKDFLPGVCAFASIEANHAMALDPRSTFGIHPYHSLEDRRNNPLADDMREAMEMITKGAKVFTLSVVTNGGKLVWADAGEIELVTQRGIELLDEIASFTITSTEKIVVSPGGYPQDKSLYHAQRALELTKNAVKPGGEILFLAECRDGVAPESAIENFYNKLTAPIDEVTESISDRYHLYEHKAYKFAELLKQVSSIKMYTDLDDETVRKVHMEKVSNVQAIIDDWITKDSDVKITVLDKGNKLAIYAR
ncbi:MAG: lactate racemase domain-containing protein [Candidatus Thorarchaeota archaeon]|nr:lactate racemase domain-containing protein [Candidatus Thorarchaeota archaeon]